MNSSLIMVADATEVERAEFYRKTYFHVAVALLIFMGVEAILLNYLPVNLILKMVSVKYAWLIILGVFWLISIFSNKLAFSPSRTVQYIGLGLYILIEAIIFLPLIFMGIYYSGGNLSLISQAALITLFLFGGLTATAFITKKDFSFLSSILMIGGFIAIGLIIAGVVWGFELGLWFSVGMVVLAAISILYQTSQIKYHYNTSQYVGAALGLFASILLLFWYILRILIAKRD